MERLRALGGKLSAGGGGRSFGHGERALGGRCLRRRWVRANRESSLPRWAFTVTSSEWPSSWWPKRIVQLGYFQDGARNQATGLPARISSKNGVVCRCTQSAA